MNEDNLLEQQLMQAFMKLKKLKHHNFFELSGLTHNEKLVLFLLHNKAKDSKILLYELRKEIQLAPSTITPIITSLEEKGLIERNIDKEDRRNIYLSVTPKGRKSMGTAHKNMKKGIQDYIQYIGKEDTIRLIELMSKTVDFFKERNDQ